MLLSELGTLLREEKGVLKSLQKEEEVMLQDMTMCTGSSLPVQDEEDGGIRSGEIKRRDKLILDLKHLSCFLIPQKKTGMSDNSVVQSAHWKTAS